MSATGSSSDLCTVTTCRHLTAKMFKARWRLQCNHTNVHVSVFMWLNHPTRQMWVWVWVWVCVRVRVHVCMCISVGVFLRIPLRACACVSCVQRCCQKPYERLHSADNALRQPFHFCRGTRWTRPSVPHLVQSREAFSYQPGPTKLGN